MSAAGIYCRKVLTRKTMKNQWFCLFFDEKSWFGEVLSQQKLDSERFLPLYLLSWRRNIISDIINTFLRFPENIIKIQSRFFRESDISPQYRYFPVHKQVSIGFPIITVQAPQTTKFRHNREKNVIGNSIQKNQNFQKFYKHQKWCPWARRTCRSDHTAPQVR